MTMTETFEQYAEQNGAAPGTPRYDHARIIWEMEQEAQRTYPATIPPCPWWCGMPAGHAYESYSPHGATVCHTRFHEAEFGGQDGMARVETVEDNVGGVVEVHQPAIVLEQKDEVTAEQARRLAADLLAAADLLERIRA